MDTLLPDLVTGRLSLVIIPAGTTRMLLELVARLAQRRPLRVLDGGNCFNAYIVARELGRYTRDVEAALERIQVARAFTCYQVLTLLEDTPADGVPTLMLQMLDTFHDENVSLAERERLLASSIQELRRLSQRSSVGISTRWPRAAMPDAMKLLGILEDAADHVWRMETEQQPVALRLF
ncbi:MAG: hypothetical protein U9R58_08520 [Chloroflexota bacterium]|nr:hypothetical protein [Chloroflexota bacterium]